MYAPSQFGNDCGICNRQGRADIEKEEGEGPRNPEQKLGVLILGLRWNIFYLKMCQGQALFGRKYLRKWEALNEINVSQRRKKEKKIQDHHRRMSTFKGKFIN